MRVRYRSQFSHYSCFLSLGKFRKRKSFATDIDFSSVKCCKSFSMKRPILAIFDGSTLRCCGNQHKKKLGINEVLFPQDENTCNLNRAKLVFDVVMPSEWVIVWISWFLLNGQIIQKFIKSNKRLAKSNIVIKLSLSHCSYSLTQFINHSFL